MPTVSRSAEQRRHPRFPAALAVLVRSLPLWTRNVSLDGLQLGCSGLHLPLLSEYLRQGPIALEISLGDAATVALRAKVLYVSGCGEDYLVGLELIEPPRAWTRWVNARWG